MYIYIYINQVFLSVILDEPEDPPIFSSSGLVVAVPRTCLDDLGSWYRFREWKNTHECWNGTQLYAFQDSNGETSVYLVYVIEMVNSSHCCGLVDCHTHQHFGKGSWDHGGTIAFQHLKEISPASFKIHYLAAFLAFFFSKIHQQIFIVALSDRVTIGTSVLGLWIFPPWETLNHKVLQPFSTSGLVEGCIRYPCMHLEFLGIFCTTMSHETSPVGWLIYEGVSEYATSLNTGLQKPWYR